MTDSTLDGQKTGIPVELEPLPATLNLLDGDAAGCCGGGACHVPAQKSQ